MVHPCLLVVDLLLGALELLEELLGLFFQQLKLLALVVELLLLLDQLLLGGVEVGEEVEFLMGLGLGLFALGVGVGGGEDYHFFG